MKRFMFWIAGASGIHASCRDCDFRLDFGLTEQGGVIEEACNTHDCLRDG